MFDILSEFSYAFGKPSAKAKIKAQAADFVVIEDLGFELTGEGEHLMVRIQKTGENTAFVANELAKACGVASKAVSWAGLKDRHAVTEQWLSVHLPTGETPDFSAFLAQYPSIKILDITRHNKKLRPGDLIGNAFTLRLTEVSDVTEVEARLEKVKQLGVPNYFGAQRFGREGNNLSEARRWGRDNVRTRNQNKRSLYLSAARSWIFNRIVSDRIEQGLFEQVIQGDVIAQQGVAGFSAPVVKEQIESLNSEFSSGTISITAALAGDNALPTADAALAIEQPIVDQEADLMALIRGNRMRHERRSIALKPQDLSWEVEGDSITLSFSLDAGSFATSIVRELVEEIPVERVYEN
ncbi:tRNA pseudouridine(13) synthase TruD [Vibrio astriarenae]|uniref:tRNA pseudouridine synthase D n=1 Tax=Vibrio astriarenae TaxID=1481923 RepID=A0A7Z2T4I8_9VIBR|nr:tRNA pseudouridine(13) synthase TruD [Vibrio astriarenae]QIA64254.1 tRNA pseudouridine(13) synthase TruD [Vibrio astriarenae]